ncbi:MAG: TrkH family potassium uptake protein [Mycoplasma sp.]|nr:TrkH family potassium uptake protein [Mycoplasma sp.]
MAYWHKFKHWINKLHFKFNNLSPYKFILLAYLFITIISAFLLNSNFSQTNESIRNGNVKFLDSLFLAASAFSDTGLTTVNLVKDFNVLGQAIVAILILTGGIGIFTIKVFIVNVILNYDISYKSNKVVSTERGCPNIGFSKQMIKVSIIFILSSILVFSFILTIIFYFSKIQFQNEIFNQFNPHHNLANSMRFGVFHTISAINNAGFDLMGDKSISPYYFSYSIHIVLIILIIIGGIGYPVIYDFYYYLKSKYYKTQFKISLFSKISIFTFLIFTLLGISGTLLIEYILNKEQYKDNHFSNIYNLIFNTISTRSAGFSTMDISKLHAGTKWLFSILMIVGNAPSSTAGGIRTTTIAIIFLTLLANFRSKNRVMVFKRTIPSQTSINALIVFVLAIFLINGSTFVILIAESHKNNFKFLDAFFIISSAFGTSGLATSEVKDLETISKLTIILIMFIGQLGISSTILVWGSRKKQALNYRYVEENVIIG